MTHPNIDPLMVIAEAYNRQTNVTPQIPYSPYLGVAALELARDDAISFDVADIPRIPQLLGPEHMAVIGAATTEAHRTRRFYTPTDDEQRRALGFVTTSLITSAAELFRGDEGVVLTDIHKPTENDPHVARGVEALQDPVRRDTFLAALGVAADLLAYPTPARRAEMYRADITRTAREHGSPQHGSPEFFAKIEALSVHRRSMADYLRRMVVMELLGARALHLQPAELLLRGLTQHQIGVLAANLTRWRPNDDWFRS